MPGISLIFPSELIESFFSFLQVPNVGHYDDGLATLESCAMHPLLCQFAEQSFYTSVTVRKQVEDPYPGLFSAAQLMDLFAEDPRISDYVRHVTIRLDFVDLQDHTPWFGEILSRAPQLESVLFSLDKFFDTGIWDILGTTDSFAALIKSPHLKTVMLTNLFNFPLSVLGGCTFKILILDNVDIQPDPQLVSKNWVPRLDSLTFSGSPVRDGFNSLSAALFPLCSNTLTSLDLDISMFLLRMDHSTGPPGGISLATFSCLRQLTLHAARFVLLGNLCCVKDRRDFNKSALPAIREFLATSPPSLTRLTLYFLIRFADGCNTEVLSEIDWQPLLEVLESPSLASLHTDLHIQVLEYVRVAQASPSILPPQIMPTVRRSADFSRLLERGALVVVPTVELIGDNCNCA